MCRFNLHLNFLITMNQLFNSPQLIANNNVSLTKLVSVKNDKKDRQRLGREKRK